MSRAATSKALEVLRFELAYQLRRRSVWILFAVLAFPLTGETNGQVLEAAERGLLFGAPLFLAQSSMTMTLLLLPLVAALVGDAATRDARTRVEPLMAAAPVGRGAYLGGRFLGAFLAGALFSTVVPLALLLAPLLHPLLGPELLGPFRPAAYAQVHLLLVLPNVLAWSALLFALATLARHPLGGWLGAVAVFAGVVVCDELLGETLGRWELARLLDSTGNTALGLMGRTWSPLEAASRSIGTDAGLAWNRCLWIALALGALALTYSRFRFGADVRGVRWRRRARRARTEERVEPARAAPVALPRARREFGPACRARQTLAIARDSLREVASGWSWLVLPFLALQVLANLEALAVRGTPYLPTTGRVLEVFRDPLVGVAIFVVLFAGELVWRERDANVQSLSDSAPAPDWARFAGKLLGLWLVVAALHGLFLAAGVLTQLARGWHELELSLYARVLFGLELVGPLWLALLALSVHVLVDHKHVGHVTMLALFLARGTLLPLLGIEHPLLVFGADPGWSWSPIRGFASSVAPYLVFEAYWAAWTLVVALVARLFWVRGVEAGPRERLRIARRRFSEPAVRRLAAGALSLALLLGAFLGYDVEVLGGRRSGDEVERRLAEYERLYGGHRDAPQPVPTATELEVELHPERHAAEIRGAHHLRNETTEPIRSLHVALSPAVETREIELDRAARVALADDDLGHRVYELEAPLLPGETLRMAFDVRRSPRGLTAAGADTAVVANGSFFVVQDWIPLVGYRPERELADAARREELGLPARAALRSLDDLAARSDRRGQERVDLRVVVGTDADQTAVAPGELVREWERDGRRWFEYATRAPIGAGYAIFSARYAVARSRAGDVALEVLHHPAHDRNVPRMLRAMEASVAELERRFGPYPHGVLRMIEYPGAGGSLHAASSAIWYQELFSLLDPDADPRGFDLVSAVVGHEVAHQWWCGRLGYAVVEGVALLGESLAWYAALGVIEREHGPEHLRRFLGFMREDFLDPRSRAGVPLLRAADWFLAYRKGPFAMYALREYVGEERVDEALRALLARHERREPPFPVSLDLYEELRAVAPEELHGLLADLFERNAFWELETRRAGVEPEPGGEWRVTLDVVARKVAVDEAGVETELALDDAVEVGAFAPGAADGAEPLHVELRRVRSGAQTITFTVPSRPARAGIDPRLLLFDVDPYDNVLDLAEPADPAN